MANELGLDESKLSILEVARHRDSQLLELVWQTLFKKRSTIFLSHVMGVGDNLEATIQCILKFSHSQVVFPLGWWIGGTWLMMDFCGRNNGSAN